MRLIIIGKLFKKVFCELIYKKDGTRKLTIKKVAGVGTVYERVKKVFFYGSNDVTCKRSDLKELRDIFSHR